MVYITSFSKIHFDGAKYVIFDLFHNYNNIPVVLDWYDFKNIVRMNKNWLINDFGAVYFNNTTNEIIFLHDIIMTFKRNDERKNKKIYPIIHINRILTDNRRENLMYDDNKKYCNKNLYKKKRIIQIPGINVNKIPTYCSYVRPEKTHGDRFVIKFNDICWKTSSSKNLSTQYKLEEAKKFLRQLKQIRPELFENYSMNGDLNFEGKHLLDSFNCILELADYNTFLNQNRTDTILCENTKNLTEAEIILLNNFKIDEQKFK